MTLTFSVTSTCFNSYWNFSALVTFTNCFWIFFLQTSQLSYQALQYRPFKTSVLLRESSTLWGLLLCKVSRTRHSPRPTPVPFRTISSSSYHQESYHSSYHSLSSRFVLRPSLQLHGFLPLSTFSLFPDSQTHSLPTATSQTSSPWTVLENEQSPLRFH